MAILQDCANPGVGYHDAWRRLPGIEHTIRTVLI